MAGSKLSLFLAVFSAAFFGIRAYHGIWFLPFFDEAEHLVGGMMLDSGAVLYSTFVDTHGPVIYMITQAYGAVFGWSSPNGARVVIVALALLVALCVATSPLLPSATARLHVLSLYLGLLASVWLLQALYMVNYHMVGGLLGGAAMAMLVAPVWFGARVEPWRAFVGGVCLALMGATAYSFGPCAFLLAVSAIWSSVRSSSRENAWTVVAGIGTAMVGVVVWLTVFGSVRGYIAFHLLYNQFVFSRFTSFGLDNFLSSLVPSVQPFALVHCLALVSWAVSFVAFLVLDHLRPTGAPRMAGPIALGMIGLLGLCARGGTLFQDGSFVVCAIVSVSLALPSVLATVGGRQRWLSQLAWGSAGTCIFAACIAFAELSMRQAVNSPGGITRAQMVLQPRIELGQSNIPLYARIRALTGSRDRILAIPFAPDVYLLSGRMPMDSYNYYLPWDAAYAKSPWLGVKHDLCADLERDPPKLVFFNNWIVWDRYAMADYAPCVLDILRLQYQQQTDFRDLYVRRNQAS